MHVCVWGGGCGRGGGGGRSRRKRVAHKSLEREAGGNWSLVLTHGQVGVGSTFRKTKGLHFILRTRAGVDRT